MAQSSAERQAAYRQRRPTAGENGERRINTWVTTGAVLALERLARRDGIPQRAMLERLILAADAAVLASLTPDTPEWVAYFGSYAGTDAANVTA
jgi:hypothetical protein